MVFFTRLGKNRQDAARIRGVIRNIVILEPDSGGLNDLEQSFREVIGPHCLVHRVARADDLAASLRAGFPYHLAVVDLDADGDDRYALLRELRQIEPDLPVVAVAERGDVDRAARAVAAGASDLLVLGAQLGQRVSTLLGKVRHLVKLYERKRVLEEERDRLYEAERARSQMLGRSPQMRELVATIQRVAAIPRPVLVIGERGTGKELVARALHEAAGADGRPMIAVNCAAFSDSLLETELFGHEKGAYTGADQLGRGRFELADGGTLFLDEIGSMSLAFQQKILRTVEYGVFTRIGGSQELRSSARIIAATNADLQAMMRRDEFLPDLYDRLAFEVIAVPPLRERKGDIRELAELFLSRFTREIPSLQGKHLTSEALRALTTYPFPGNVREMKNIIERAAYRGEGSEITAADLGLPEADVHRHSTDFRARVDAFKRTLVENALAASAGNQAAAARRLGLSYDQLRYYYRRYRS
jgi:DNA-binding NtrC family response regulator